MFLKPFKPRKYPHKRLDGFATIIINKSDQQISAPIESISRKGIGVFTKERLKPGTEVQLNLYCSIENSRVEYRFTGTVTGEAIKETFGIVSIVFKNEINPDEHNRLFRYLADS